MNDSELRNQLLQTCPVMPGQEGRAWLAFQARLSRPPARRLLGIFQWQFAAGAIAALIAIAMFDLGHAMRSAQHGLAFADSQVPGIYATSFYSHTAKAQVVWLNGMDPATDKPTYLDPTSVIRTSRESADSKNSDRL